MSQEKEGKIIHVDFASRERIPDPEEDSTGGITYLETERLLRSLDDALPFVPDLDPIGLRAEILKQTGQDPYTGKILLLMTLLETPEEDIRALMDTIQPEE